MSDVVAKAAQIVRAAIAEFNPTHIVSMVSGGKDSAASDQVARELGVKIDLCQVQHDRGSRGSDRGSCVRHPRRVHWQATDSWR